MHKYKNFIDKQEVEIEDGIICIVGKNESVKTTFLEVMSKSNYFLDNNTDCKFNKVFNYPRSEPSKVNRDKLESNQSTCCYSLSNKKFYIIYNLWKKILVKV